MSPPADIRILIVDDHPVVCHGVVAAVRHAPELEVLGAVSSLREALLVCGTGQPDVVLVDLQLPGTPPEQAVVQLHAAHPPARILLLSTDEAGENLCRALGAGAAGSISRTAGPQETVEAIRAVHAGAAWLSPELAEQCRAYRASDPLSEDELACLRLYATGKNRREIAGLLHSSEREVRDRMRRIRAKLGAKNETHALFTALQRGIVSLE